MLSQKHQDSQINSNALTLFDFGNIEMMDPSLNDGSRIIFDREFSCKIRLMNNKSTDISDDLRVKILIQGDDKNPRQIRIEMSSDCDLFFLFMHVATPTNFEAIKEQNKLQILYKDYPSVCIRSLNQSLTNSHHLLLTLRHDNTGVLSVQYEGEFKKIPLMTFEMHPCPEEMIRQHIMYKYGSLRSKISVFENRINDISDIVKQKSPSLLAQIQQTRVSDKDINLKAKPRK